MTDDVIVYDDRTHYIAHFGEDGWYRWPAERAGWRQRKACMAPVDGDGACEMRPFNAQLALVLSGVERARER